MISEANNQQLRIWLVKHRVDFRKGHNGLLAECYAILEGCLQIEFQDQESIELRPDDIFTVPSKMIHRTIAKTRTVNLCFELTKGETVFLQNESTQHGIN